MKTMKKDISLILLLLTLLISFVITTTAESSIIDSMEFQGDRIDLTLEKAIEIVLKDNPTIKQSELSLEQAEVKSKQIISAGKDNKKLYSNYKREGTIGNLLVYKLPKLNADFVLANAKRNYEATVENLKADIEKSYFELLQLEQMNEINKEDLDIAKDIYKKTKQKFELGLVTKQEVISSELNLKKAENSYIASENMLKKAKMAFNIKLGYDVMTKVNLIDELGYKEFEGVSIADVVSKALINRNEIKAAEFKYELEKINMDITAKQYTENTYVYRDQKIKLEKALKDLNDIKKNIEMEVRSNYLDIKEKYEEIKAGEKAVELAKEALRLYQLSYDVGTAILTDVQEAQTSLLQARLGLSKAILEYNLAISKFEDSIGVGRTVINM
jgi:outer membrane protein TolC